MPCKDFISYDIKPLSLEDSTIDALNILEEYQLEQMPIIDENHLYKGIITYEILANSKHALIKEIAQELPLLKAAIQDNAFPYRATKIMYENNLDIIPVVNKEDKYIGIINKTSMLDFLVKDSGLLQSGGIVILEIKTFNYSLSEIARICETNDVLILNLQIKSIPEEDVMHIILKTNSKDLSALEATFQRFEYQVSVIDADKNVDSLVQQRYEMLMQYLKL